MELIIHQTTNYSLFESITGNRSLNEKKIIKICEDIVEGFNMLPYCPIIVSDNNGKFGIIDGQHRREVSERTGNPVYYVVCNTLTLKQIAMLNSRGEKWKVTDFLNCYINLGIEDYKVLQQVMNDHGVQARTAIDMLMFNVPSTSSNVSSTDIFQNGGFQVKFLEETESLLRQTQELFGQYRFSKDVKLLYAVQILNKKEKCDFERLKSKIAQAPMMMDKCANTKLYLSNIERVYNYKSQTRETLF